jgi:sigma-B regulation protein RsbU (phosphoserine phosphatase)
MSQERFSPQEIEKIVEENRRYRSALNEAREVQKSSLSCEIPQIPGWDLGAASDPAHELSGDLLDIIEVQKHSQKPGEEPERILHVIQGDAAGKDIPAAILSTATHALLHSHFHPQKIDETFLAANYGLRESIKNPGNFVTVIDAQLNIKTGDLQWTRAGHTRPLLLEKKGKRIKQIKIDDGVGQPLNVALSPTFAHGHWQMTEGGKAFVYTDGVEEAHNGKGHFGERRIIKTIRDNWNLPVQEICDIVIEKANKFSKDKQDDKTIFGLARL